MATSRKSICRTGRRSGLIDAMEVMKGVEGISFVPFERARRVRHTLVLQRIVSLRALQRDIGAGPAAQFEARRPAVEAAPRRARPPRPLPARLRHAPERLHVLPRRLARLLSWRSHLSRCVRAPCSGSRASCKAQIARGRPFWTASSRETHRCATWNRSFAAGFRRPDVLSFPAGDIQAGVRKTGRQETIACPTPAGDIAISLPRARAQAKRWDNIDRARGSAPDTARSAAPSGPGSRKR